MSGSEHSTMASGRKPGEADNSKPDDPEQAVKDEVCNLDRVSFDRQRDQLAKRHSIRAETLDRLYRESRREKGETGGDALEIEDADPWPDPVDGAALLDALADTFNRYLALPPGAADACALWSLYTFAYDAFVIAPLLAITSPTKRCGKTTLVDVLERVVRRPLSNENISPSALFRSIEKWRPTLLVDEADTFLRDREELRGILNSGHRKGGRVIRTVGDDHEPKAFSTFGPKAIALIGKLPGTLADRSIEVPMRRRRPGERVERLRVETNFSPLPEKATRWVNDHRANLRDSHTEPPASLNDRAADNWRPLLAVAEVAGGDWPKRALRALQAIERGEAEDSPGILLLADTEALLDKLGRDQIASQALADHLATLEDRPWPEWSHGRPITVRQIARLLDGFGINPGRIREGSQQVRGYRREDFRDALSRYTPSQSVTPSHLLQDKASSDFQSVTRSKPVTDGNPLNPLGDKACDGVTDEDPVSAEGGANGAAPEPSFKREPAIRECPRCDGEGCPECYPHLRARAALEASENQPKRLNGAGRKFPHIGGRR